jgi:hypothetical protein
MKHRMSDMGEIGGTGNHYQDPLRDDGSGVEFDHPHTCDACPGCDDYCSIPFCTKCKHNRLHRTSQTQRRGEYTMCQVRRHCRRTDCWLVAHGRVYNATGFIDGHPAGPKPILSRAGQDCTVDFDFHSKVSQREYWRPLMIGRVVPCPLRGGCPPSVYSICSIQ